VRTLCFVSLNEPSADEPAPGCLRLVLQAPLWGPQRAWVRIDGVPVPTTPRENLIPIAPGHHTIEIDDAMRPVTSGTFEVLPGGTTNLWFAPGFSRFDLGGLGPEPQRTRGPRFLLLVAVIIVVGLLFELLVR
jgi:hypothetical protein